MQEQFKHFSDTQLWEMMSRGDQQAFAVVIDRYRGLVYSLSYVRLGDQHQSEEVLWDVFLALWKHASRYPQNLDLKNYIIKCTHNRIARLQKRQARFRKIEYGVEVDMAVPAQNLDSEFLQHIIASIAKKRQQQELQLYLQGSSYRDISYATGRSYTVVKKSMGRLFQDLRNKWSKSL